LQLQDETVVVTVALLRNHGRHLSCNINVGSNTLAQISQGFFMRQVLLPILPLLYA
jgi:hypothetical protein